MDIENLKTEIQGLPTAVCRDLVDNVNKYLNKAGLYYRSFSRIKSADSALEKITTKKYSETKKMQDLLGVRIALYFREDVEICCDIISNKFDVIDISKDKETPENFRPTRLNYVCNLPTNIAYMLSNSLWEYPIDKTFEVQIRTIFSEGWHEVEHDLRYKSKSEWIQHSDLSRNLNGIFATLETCDWAIGNVFSELAYRKFKEKNWESMLRNQLKIHIDNYQISNEIRNQLNVNASLAKELFRIDRKDFLLKLSNSKLGDFPKTPDNLILTANALYIHNTELIRCTPIQIQNRVQEVLTQTLKNNRSLL